MTLGFVTKSLKRGVSSPMPSEASHYQTKNPCREGHYYSIPKWIFSEQYRTLPQRAKQLYSIMGGYCQIDANKKGIAEANKCWPNVARLTRDLGCSRRQVFRLLRLLETQRLIKRVRRDNKSNIYYLIKPSHISERKDSKKLNEITGVIDNDSDRTLLSFDDDFEVTSMSPYINIKEREIKTKEHTRASPDDSASENNSEKL